MAGNGPGPDSSSPHSDDINDRLAEVAAELASEAKFKEPSAAERARSAGGQRRRAAGTPPAPPAATPGKRNGRLRRRRNRRAGSWPAPDRGYATPSRRPGRGRSVLAIVAIFALLIAVSFGLHALLH